MGEDKEPRLPTADRAMPGVLHIPKLGIRYGRQLLQSVAAMGAAPRIAARFQHSTSARMTARTMRSVIRNAIGAALIVRDHSCAINQAGVDRSIAL